MTQQRREPSQPDADINLDEEVRLAVATRRELAAAHEDQIIAAFLEKLQAAVEQRVRQAVEQSGRSARRSDPVGRLAVSLIFAIPLSAIAAGIAGLPGLAVAWAGIILLNIYFDRISR